MRTYGSSTRISAAIALVLQLVLAVGLPVADASHGIRSDRRAHVEQEDSGPCSSGHTPDCQLARVLGAGAVPPLEGRSVSAPAVSVPLASPVDDVVVLGSILDSAHGPRAPPHG